MLTMFKRLFLVVLPMLAALTHVLAVIYSAAIARLLSNHQ